MSDNNNNNVQNNRSMMISTNKGSPTLLLITAAASLVYERHLQKKLTAIPKCYYQSTSFNQTLHSLMSSVLMRHIRPSLLVGTHAIMNSSIGGYVKLGPRHPRRIREIVVMTFDGAQVALDWELPEEYYQKRVMGMVVKEESHNNNNSDFHKDSKTNNDADDDDDELMNEDEKDDAMSDESDDDDDGVRDSRLNEAVIKGPHTRPIILLLHGINNDSSFGYIRSMMAECNKNGWIAVGMNMRGCDHNLHTPRGYNGAFTGDLRLVVQHLCRRLAEGQSLFAAGYSLGANILIKYLGEEGLSGTLPKQVAGGISLGNPLGIINIINCRSNNNLIDFHFFLMMIIYY